MEKKELNIWKNKQEAEIADIEDDRPVRREEDPMATPFVLNMKVPNLVELDRTCNATSLQTYVGSGSRQNNEVDLGILLQNMIPKNDIYEVDELWEFKNLKHEISIMVGKV